MRSAGADRRVVVAQSSQRSAPCSALAAAAWAVLVRPHSLVPTDDLHRADRLVSDRRSPLAAAVALPFRMPSGPIIINAVTLPERPVLIR